MTQHKILNIASAHPRLQNLLSEELGISKVMAQILINRGINNLEDAERFLNINPDDLLDPYQFSQMAIAVNIVRQIAKNKEKVMVFGDYDVDGITALTLLKNTLFQMGLEVEHYLPHRIKEGYGLNKNILQLAKQRDIKLLITVDCGTNSHAEIRELRRHNIEVIITDHHEPVTENVPPASASINPKLKDSGYRYRDLAGVGVAYKFCQALAGKKLFEDLDLVCLGTVADVVPLTGENRILVKEGLSKLSQTKRPGLKALIENSGISKRRITSEFVSYILGPRINASGRVDTAETALNLLMSTLDREASTLAAAVETHNRQRQKIENRVMQEAEDLIDREVNFKEHKIIVVAKEDWHQGVLGIVAAKIAERFYRPTILISKSADLCKGSGRSIKNFHLFDALLECQRFLKTFGGHSHAAGLMIAKDNIEDFKNQINCLAGERLRLEDLLPCLDIDIEVNLADLDDELLEELKRLEPFGTDNPEPLFYTRNLKLKGKPQVLARDTLKFWVSDDEVTYQAIGFGMAGMLESLCRCESLDLVYTPKLDAWNGIENIILEAKDIFFR